MFRDSSLGNTVAILERRTVELDTANANLLLHIQRVQDRVAKAETTIKRLEHEIDPHNHAVQAIARREELLNEARAALVEQMKRPEMTPDQLALLTDKLTALTNRFM